MIYLIDLVDILNILIFNICRRRVDTVARENVTVSRNVQVAETEPEPEFIPYSTDRPVGLDLDEFLPVSNKFRIFINFLHVKIKSKC